MMQNEKKLVVLFPGFGYGPDKPLLYYAAKVARRQGLDCMVVQYSQLFPHEETPQASAAKSYPGAALPSNDFPLRRRRIVSVANIAVTTERMGMNIYQISFLSCRVAA